MKSIIIITKTKQQQQQQQQQQKQQQPGELRSTSTNPVTVSPFEANWVNPFVIVVIVVNGVVIVVVVIVIAIIINLYHCHQSLADVVIVVDYDDINNIT